MADQRDIDHLVKTFEGLLRFAHDGEWDELRHALIGIDFADLAIVAQGVEDAGLPSGYERRFAAVFSRDEMLQVETGTLDAVLTFLRQWLLDERLFDEEEQETLDGLREWGEREELPAVAVRGVGGLGRGELDAVLFFLGYQEQRPLSVRLRLRRVVHHRARRN